MLAAILIINKLLQTKNFDIIKTNNLDVSQFIGCQEEFNFIVEHQKKYGNVPDEMPFAERFPNFEPVLVNETDEYLVDKLHEEYGFQKFSEMLPKLNAKLKEDSRLAYDFLRDNMTNLRPHTVCKGFDIISGAEKRYEEYHNKKTATTPLTISTGFPELDEIIGGIESGEELITCIARTGVGKSWFLTKLLSTSWAQGKKVGLYSGEMDVTNVGYRFDALNGHISHLSLMRGAQINEYDKYIDNLKESKNKFIVVTQRDFGGKPTVQQLRNFVDANGIEVLGVDQLSLMDDGRANKNDPLRLRLAHITEDLFTLSTEYKIPVIALAQANRDTSKRDTEAPELENIKESDDISHNSSKCIGLAKNNNRLILSVMKNRYGRTGDKLFYAWDVDGGNFTHLKTETNDGGNSTISKQTEIKSFTDMNKITMENPF